jgi:hypothetical protein
MNINEILEQSPVLTNDERQQLQTWLESNSFEESPALLAAVEEGFRSMEQGPMLSIEQALETVKRCATKSN